MSTVTWRCLFWLEQKPSPLLTAGAGGLLRCFVRREAGGERSSVAKFVLYLGSEHNQPEACKFLMAALLNSRCGALWRSLWNRRDAQPRHPAQ